MGFQLPDGTTVTVETKWFPPMVVDLTGKQPISASGQAAGIATAVAVKLIKPRVTLRFAGSVVKTWQPAGSPDPNEWPKTRIALLVAAGFLAFKLIRLVL